MGTDKEGEKHIFFLLLLFPRLDLCGIAAAGAHDRVTKLWSHGQGSAQLSSGFLWLHLNPEGWAGLGWGCSCTEAPTAAFVLPGECSGAFQ